MRWLGNKTDPGLVKKYRTAGHWKAYSSKSEGELGDDPHLKEESKKVRHPPGIQLARVCTTGRAPENRSFGDYKHQAPTFSTPPGSSRPLGDTGLDNSTAAQEFPHQGTLRLQQPRRAARMHRGTYRAGPCAATVARDADASAGRDPAGSLVPCPWCRGCKLRAQSRASVSGSPVLGSTAVPSSCNCCI